MITQNQLFLIEIKRFYDSHLYKILKIPTIFNYNKRRNYLLQILIKHLFWISLKEDSWDTLF